MQSRATHFFLEPFFICVGPFQKHVSELIGLVSFRAREKKSLLHDLY